MLAPSWLAADNKEVIVWDKTPILESLLLFSIYIMCEREFFWRILDDHNGYLSYCSFGKVIGRNTDKSLSAFNGFYLKLCGFCRGKGHPWAAVIINGQPYKTCDWREPHWFCEACNGSGVIMLDHIKRKSLANIT